MKIEFALTQFPWRKKKPQCQSLGKSAVRIIYCCRTIKWLLADKSRCVQCVQQKAEREREAFTNGENVAFCAKFDSPASIFHKLLLLLLSQQKNTSGPKSRQSLPGDPWLVWSCKHTKTNQCTLILLSKTFPFFLCQSSFSADKLYERIWFPRPESPGKYHGNVLVKIVRLFKLFLKINTQSDTEYKRKRMWLLDKISTRLVTCLLAKRS